MAHFHSPHIYWWINMLVPFPCSSCKYQQFYFFQVLELMYELCNARSIQMSQYSAWVWKTPSGHPKALFLACCSCSMSFILISIFLLSIHSQSRSLKHFIMWYKYEHALFLQEYCFVLLTFIQGHKRDVQVNKTSPFKSVIWQGEEKEKSKAWCPRNFKIGKIFWKINIIYKVCAQK